MRISLKMKSFLFGVGRLLDVGSTFSIVHPAQTDGVDIDALAISQDWQIVGDDIRHSIETVESERVA